MKNKIDNGKIESCSLFINFLKANRLKRIGTDFKQQTGIYQRTDPEETEDEQNNETLNIIKNLLKTPRFRNRYYIIEYSLKKFLENQRNLKEGK